MEDTIQFNVREYCAPGAPRGKSHADAVLPTGYSPKPISSVSNTTDALQHMQEANPELLSFLSTIVSKVNDLKYTIDHQRRDDVSYLSEDSINTEESTFSKRNSHANRRRNKIRNKKKSKTPSRESPLEPTRILQHGDTLPTFPTTTPHQHTRHTSTTNHMSAAEVRNFTLRRSFKEELNKHFPPHVHAAILEMGLAP